MRVQCFNRSEGLASVQFSACGDDQLAPPKGKVRGPFCVYSRTLPATIQVQEGEATVVDPCYWTPKLPFLYEAQLTWESPTGMQTAEFRFGLRRYTLDKSGVRLNGKWNVARFVSDNRQVDLDALRQASAALWMTEFDRDVCQRASERGVLVACANPLSEEQILAIQSCPAVVYVNAYNGESYPESLPTDIIPLVAEPKKGAVMVAAEQSLSGSPAKALAATDAGDASVPRFVVRQTKLNSTAELRRECDHLQRDLASVGQFAGYVCLGDQER